MRTCHIASGVMRAVLCAAALAVPLTGATQSAPLPQAQRSTVIPGDRHNAGAGVRAGLVQRTCPNMVVAPVAGLPDGGYVDVGQGWLYKAALGTGATAALYCDYGADRNEPARRHKFQVHYSLPGVDVARCSLQGYTVSCAQ